MPLLRRCLLGAALLAATALAYVPSLDGEFQFDDVAYIDRLERGDLTLGQILREHGRDRPLTLLTLRLDYEIAGLDVRVFHATNVVFHLVTVALVFVLTRVTLRRFDAEAPAALGAFVAALFALHPLQTQAVSYVIQRAEVLASIFYAATLLLLLASEPPASRSVRLATYSGAVLAFGLGLAAKPVIVTAPVAYVLHRAFFPRRDTPAPWRAVLARGAPLAVLAAYMAWGWLGGASGNPHVGLDVPRLSPVRYALTQLSVVATYLRMLAWPSGQSIDHDFPLSDGPTDPRTLVGAATLALVVSLGAWGLVASRSWPSGPGRTAARAAAFGVAWFLLLLAPTSSVVPFADVLVEHRVYLSAWGIFLAVAAGAYAVLTTVLPATRRRVVATALAALVASALFGATWQRNEIWRSQLTLWGDAARKAPAKARARWNYATALTAADRPDEGIGEVLAALRLVGEKPVLLRGLGGALYKSGRLAEAISALQRALVLAPGDARTLTDLAVCLATARQFADAEKTARQALAADPRFALAHMTLGNIRLEQGDARGALASYASAEALAPHLGTPALNAAVAHAELGNPQAACTALARYRRVTAREAPWVRDFAREHGCPDPGR